MADPLDPIKQFEIHKMKELKIGNFDVSFTNSALMMVVTVGLICLFMFVGSSKKSLIPGRMQSITEVSYEFVANMIRSTAGKDGMKFFPLIFGLFMFILFANMLGLIPFFFTTTSHIIVTFALAALVFLTVVIVGFWKNRLKFLKLFWPSGVPVVLKVLLVTPLEIISFLSRPLSHSVRLWANMLAGHIMLKLFAGFAIMMFAGAGAVKLGAIAPFAMTVILTPLEILVAFLQAYVFTILTCVYISDALHPGH